MMRLGAEISGPVGGRCSALRVVLLSSPSALLASVVFQNPLLQPGAGIVDQVYALVAGARIHNRAHTRFGVFFAVAGRLAEISHRLAAHVLPALSRQSGLSPHTRGLKPNSGG